ncbi:MAG: aldo/keto reductase [Clostridia bacterium]|nr:aldo/keto reductase [Clostridia bacterium]
MQMITFPGTDITASRLGMGCMRLPVDGDKIDRPAAIKLIRDAIDNGVTYIDTAYGYHNRESEIVVGEALKDGYRERVTLVTKLPVWLVEKPEDMEKLLDEQLEKLQTDHVDFYLLHALSWGSYEKVRNMGAREFLDRMIEKGKIRYPAFSFHDDAEAFRKIITDYPWKMAQVQMNVLDEFNQATLEGCYKYAEERGIGLVVMEPLRGGALARNIPDEIQSLYDQAAEKRTPVEWAFRWLYDKTPFMTILSGMSNTEQLMDNIRIFSGAEFGVMTQDEKDMMTKVRETYEARVRVGCTGCEYCMPCPKGVKIPNIFRSLDNAAMFNTLDGFKKRYAAMVEKGEGANQCVKCGLCEKACPQHIQIRQKLAEIHEEFAE